MSRFLEIQKRTILTRHQGGTNIDDMARDRYFNLWTIIAFIHFEFQKNET